MINLSTLQINLAPSDFRHATSLLPHQLKVWSSQVDEVLLVIDLHRSAGRFSDGWEAGKDSLFALIGDLKGVRTVFVDYGEDASKRVAQEWTGGHPVPEKDFRGGPSYAYFYGLTQAKGRYVLHSDSDMFFGGGSQQWINEAVDLFERSPDILFMAPHSGPPSPDGRIKTLSCEPDARIRGGQRFKFMSTRLFMIDKERFSNRITAFTPRRPDLRSQIKAFVEGNPTWDLPEHWMTRSMINEEMCRFEFLGSGEGMWSLHPPYRCDDFYRKLPDLVRRVESGEIPSEQLGCHDINESMVDWSEARNRLKRNRWWKRLF